MTRDDRQDALVTRPELREIPVQPPLAVAKRQVGFQRGKLVVDRSPFDPGELQDCFLQSFPRQNILTVAFAPGQTRGN